MHIIAKQSDFCCYKCTCTTVLLCTKEVLQAVQCNSWNSGYELTGVPTVPPTAGVGENLITPKPQVLGQWDTASAAKHTAKGNNLGAQNRTVQTCIVVCINSTAITHCRFPIRGNFGSKAHALSLPCMQVPTSHASPGVLLRAMLG